MLWSYIGKRAPSSSPDRGPARGTAMPTKYAPSDATIRGVAVLLEVYRGPLQRNTFLALDLGPNQSHSQGCNPYVV